MAEWLKALDCKSDRNKLSYAGSNPAFFNSRKY